MLYDFHKPKLSGLISPYLCLKSMIYFLSFRVNTLVIKRIPRLYLQINNNFKLIFDFFKTISPYSLYLFIIPPILWGVKIYFIIYLQFIHNLFGGSNIFSTFDPETN